MEEAARKTRNPILAQAAAIHYLIAGDFQRPFELLELHRQWVNEFGGLPEDAGKRSSDLAIGLLRRHSADFVTALRRLAVSELGNKIASDALRHEGKPPASPDQIGPRRLAREIQAAANSRQLPPEYAQLIKSFQDYMPRFDEHRSQAYAHLAPATHFKVDGATVKTHFLRGLPLSLKTLFNDRVLRAEILPLLGIPEPVRSARAKQSADQSLVHSLFLFNKYGMLDALLGKLSGGQKKQAKTKKKP